MPGKSITNPESRDFGGTPGFCGKAANPQSPRTKRGTPTLFATYPELHSWLVPSVPQKARHLYGLLGY